jgi:hypothetical protein
MITASTLITLFVVFLGGHFALALFRPSRRRGAAELHGTALLLGLALLPALVTGLALAIGPLGVGLTRALAAVLCAGGAIALYRRHQLKPSMEARPPLRSPRSAEELLCLLGFGLILAFGAFIVFYTATMPMHIFDPVFHFAYKGKLLYSEGLMTSSWMDVEDSLGRIITHPDYPPGVGALEAFCGWIGGVFSEDAARPLFALFALALGAFLFGTLKDLGRSGSWLAPITGTLLWLSTPFLYYSRLPHDNWVKGAYGLFFGPDAAQAKYGDTIGPKGPILGEWSTPDGWTLDGAGDLPLAALFCSGFIVLLRFVLTDRERRDTADLLIAGALLGGGALMKNEGLALLPVVVIAIGITWLLELRRKPATALKGRALSTPSALALTMIVALVVASPWLAVRGDIPTIGEDYPSRLSPSGLLESWSSTQPVHLSPSTNEIAEVPVPRIVGGGFLDAFTQIPRFGIVWLLFLATCVLGLARPKRFLRTPAFPAALVVLGACALYALVLLVTPWNLEALFNTAIPDRLIFHVAPLAIFASILILDHSGERE